MNASRNCSNCRFFCNSGSETGECRKRAPQVLHVPEVERLSQRRALRAISYWPPINQSEWCGEHEIQT